MDCSKREALHQLYERTGRAAIAKTARLVGRTDVAEEIVQTAFLKLWDAGLRFPSERAAYAWVYRACHNAGIDYIRTHAVQFEASASARELEVHADPAAPHEAFAERQTLILQMGRLDDREAQVLAYRLLDEMTQGDIAEVMALSRKTVVRICAQIVRKFAQDAELFAGPEAEASEASPSPEILERSATPETPETREKSS